MITRKLATALLVTASAGAFATLGDGGKKGTHSNIASPSKLTAKNFSLRSGYNYKANQLFTSNQPAKFIMMNTAVTYHKGNATYILPVKKKVILDKVKFNPAPPRF
ncbi:MAG: hypothetical protein ACXWV0_00920 [Flavisolibacter sp.]